MHRSGVLCLIIRLTWICVCSCFFSVWETTLLLLISKLTIKAILGFWKHLYSSVFCLFPSPFWASHSLLAPTFWWGGILGKRTDFGQALISWQILMSSFGHEHFYFERQQLFKLPLSGGGQNDTTSQLLYCTSFWSKEVLKSFIQMDSILNLPTIWM